MIYAFLFFNVPSVHAESFQDMRVICENYDPTQDPDCDPVEGLQNACEMQRKCKVFLDLSIDSDPDDLGDPDHPEFMVPGQPSFEPKIDPRVFLHQQNFDNIPLQ